MPEHLTREEISTLLDEPGSVPGALTHLGVCEECSREYEQMSRMRMALSALPDLEPPAGEWSRIEEKLGASSPSEVRPMAIARLLGARWPVQAAAVLTLFAGGLLVGQRVGIRSASQSSAGRDPVEQRAVPAAGESADLLSEPATAYVRTAAELQELRAQFPDEEGWLEDPAAVAERITMLDAIIDASREALGTAPSDPVLNNFLFEVVDEREDLAGRLDEALRLTTAEY